MKHWMLGVLLVGLLSGFPAPAHAGVGDWFRNGFKYLWSPINCIGQLGAGLVDEVVVFGYCVLNNVNRNPATLETIVKVNPDPEVTVEQPAPTDTTLEWTDGVPE